MLDERTSLLIPEKKKSCFNWNRWVLLTFVMTALLIFAWVSHTSNTSVTSGVPAAYVDKEAEVTADASSYIRVGYIEHVTYYKNVSTKTDAQSVMNYNIGQLEANIKIAALSGVQLVQLSEFALTGLINFVAGESLAYSRMFLYLEQIPTPNLGTASTPCGNSAFSGRPILQRLSCIAKSNAIYISVNWGDYVYCSNSTDTNCKNGHYQYNTQIVFSSSGEVVAKYWKIHLFNEGEFDTPSTDDPTYFNMTYSGSKTVKIGLFTCFDSMYATPSWTLMNNYNINFFLISHWWVNSGTTSTAIQWFESLSRKYGINLVVASSGWFNGAYTPRDSSGSGVFSQGVAISSYFNWNAVNTDFFGYGDVNVNIDGPYQKSTVPSYVNITSSLGLTAKYTSLGSAYPGTTLSGVANCASFTCKFSMKVSSTSSSYLPDYWMMFCADGYYYQADGRKVYYYEQICGAYKYYNSSYISTMTFSNTKFDSFYLTANFSKNAVPFILMMQDFGYSYSRITTTTSYTLSNGNYKLNGSNLNGDKLLDVVAQSRDFTKDGYKV